MNHGRIVFCGALDKAAKLMEVNCPAGVWRVVLDRDYVAQVIVERQGVDAAGGQRWDTIDGDSRDYERDQVLALVLRTFVRIVDDWHLPRPIADSSATASVATIDGDPRTPTSAQFAGGEHK